MEELEEAEAALKAEVEGGAAREAVLAERLEVSAQYSNVARDRRKGFRGGMEGEGLGAGVCVRGTQARYVAEQSRLEGEKEELVEEVGRQRREKGAAVECSEELRGRVEELVAQQRELRGAREDAEKMGKQLGQQLQGVEAELAERSGQVAALERSLQETKQQAAEVSVWSEGETEGVRCFPWL